ncbi:MAG: hypothetical protein H7Y12_08950 [Sphingobacteriaceae bacterium]|nr:hypothetical protein [Cytophagaceae bacterium]
MKTLFVCLAHWLEATNHHLAGIVVTRTDTGLSIARDEAGQPRWIRPIVERGEAFPASVAGVQLRDLVEVETLRAAAVAAPHQPENTLVDPDALLVVKALPLNAAYLDRLANQEQTVLLGTPGGVVPAEAVGGLDHSLTFVRVRKARAYQSESGVLRLRFLFGETFYDFPVTDAEFSQRHALDPTLLSSPSEVFLSLALGAEEKGKYMKQVVGVIPV